MRLPACPCVHFLSSCTRAAPFVLRLIVCTLALLQLGRWRFRRRPALHLGRGHQLCRPDAGPLLRCGVYRQVEPLPEPVGVLWTRWHCADLVVRRQPAGHEPLSRWRHRCCIGRECGWYRFFRSQQPCQCPVFSCLCHSGIVSCSCPLFFWLSRCDRNIAYNVLHSWHCRARKGRLALRSRLPMCHAPWTLDTSQ